MTTSVSSSTPASFSDLLSFGVWGGPEEAYLPPADLEGALGGKVAGGGGGSSRRCGKVAGAPPAAGGWWTTGWSAEAAGASTGDELAREWQRGRIRRWDGAGDEEGGRGGGDSAISKLAGVQKWDAGVVPGWRLVGVPCWSRWSKLWAVEGWRRRFCGGHEVDDDAEAGRVMR